MEMSDREVMQQALEALEYMHQEKCDYMRRNNLGNPLLEDAARIALPAIEALHARLAEPQTCKPDLQVEEAEPVAWMGVSGVGEEIVSKSRLYSFMTTPLYTALRARLAEPEPVTLKWSSAPCKTEWGFGMVCADVEIDRDHTLTLYCEEDQTAKVDAMLSLARRPLTDEEIDELPWCPSFENPMTLAEGLRHFARAVERKITGGNDE